MKAYKNVGDQHCRGIASVGSVGCFTTFLLVELSHVRSSDRRMTQGLLFRQGVSTEKQSLLSALSFLAPNPEIAGSGPGIRKIIHFNLYAVSHIRVYIIL